MPPRQRSSAGLALLGWLLGALVTGYAYGWLASSLPSPDDPEVFWFGNLAAPFVVLPFVLAAWASHPRTPHRAGGATTPGATPGARAGATTTPSGIALQARAVAGVAVGAMTGAGMVAGFYALHRVGRDPHADPGQAEGLAGAYLRWFSTFVLGRPGGAPWLTIGVLSGGLAGWLAWAWVRRGSRLAGLVAVSPLLLEPLVRVAAGGRGLPLAGGYPRLPGNLALWAAEAAVGVAAVWLVLRRTSTERSPAPA